MHLFHLIKKKRLCNGRRFSCSCTEEYEHAIKRGAKIYAEISGYANTCDAYHMTAPHPEAFGSIKMIELLLKEYGSKIDQKTI
jgi:3-oxoacyl-(acyl-carrier-protein) synthase